jgi:dUTP pyrophosphatase
MERAAVPTGWRVAVPKGFEIQVRARSGLSSKVGLTLINGIGTIDSDFRGEVHILMVNLGREPVAIKRGDRIAQFVVAPVVRARWIRDDVSTAETLRGESGFGSSGIA